MEKVSVIVPIFNQEKYLNRSVNSIIRQTWTNLEILLVNDGSTDNSLRMMIEYHKKDKRIVVINQENKGLAGAVIAGMERFTGDYVCFVDPDDYVKEDFVETFMNEIGANDFVAMGYYSICNTKAYQCSLVESREYSREELIQKRDMLYNEFGKLDLSKRFGVSRCNKLYRKDLIKQVLPKYIECRDVSLGEDSMFTFLALSYAQSGKTARNINGYFYDNQSDNSMCRHTDSNAFLDKMGITYKCFLGLLEQNNSPLCQATYLYYLLGIILMGRLREQNNIKDFSAVYKSFHSDKVFLDAFDQNIDLSKRGRIKKILFKEINNPHIYLFFLCVFEKALWVMDAIRNKREAA